MQRRHRLRSSATIGALHRHGRRQHHPLAVLLSAPTDEPISRFGFSASRRVGNAVRRNRAKRLLREAVRLNIERISPGWDCLLIARSATPEAAFVEVEAAVLQLLNLAGILVDETS